MFSLMKIANIPLLTIITIATFASCKRAEYEFIKPQSANSPKTLNPPTNHKFNIEGPTIGNINTPLIYEGKDCGPENSGKITWVVAGTSIPMKEGPKVTYTFERPNTYVVQATCEVPGLPPQTDIITVVISVPDNNQSGIGSQNGSQNKSQN